MGLEIFSLIGGFPFLPGPLERSSTVSQKQLTSAQIGSGSGYLFDEGFLTGLGSKLN